MTRPGLPVFRPFKKEPELPLEAVEGGSLGVDSDRRAVVLGGGGDSGSLGGDCVGVVGFDEGVLEDGVLDGWLLTLGGV